jgi:uncharacterized protein YprB with RNaseH-like and TPR domain
MFTPELRRRLSEISRGKAAAASVPVESSCAADYSLAFDFSGSEERNDLGPFCVCKYRMSDFLPEAAEIADRVVSLGKVLGRDPSRLLFVDLETCGLANVPVFLVGAMQMIEGDFRICQLFARDYSEERAMLGRVREMIDETDGLVTFNGKSFDVPFLRDRMVFHRLEFAQLGVHFDILPPARRKWRGKLPDCKLQTLETFICNRSRSGDIPGSEIPGIYHQFVRSGDMDPLIPVFKHNVMDLMTMAELLPEIL